MAVQLMTKTSPDVSAWPEEIHAILRDNDVRQIAYVPDAGHATLIKLCHADQTIRTVALTTEEEGVALIAGAWLGGQRGALLMQSSGVGNCINMLSLIQECRFPFLTLVTMRGQWGEGNPWQLTMGQGTPRALRSVGVLVQSVDQAERVPETVAAAARLAFECNRAVAVLIGQRVLGAKKFEKKHYAD
jgi:sulfopyruvate decarboxylase alpha subunit